MGTRGDNAIKQRPGEFERQQGPATIRYLEEIGVSSGWQCLEIGAGKGTIAGWLCRRVGTDGHVVATDLDTQSLEAIDSPNIEVLPTSCSKLVRPCVRFRRHPKKARCRSRFYLVDALDITVEILDIVLRISRRLRQHR